jgi:hypothetical protein
MNLDGVEPCIWEGCFAVIVTPVSGLEVVFTTPYSWVPNPGPWFTMGWCWWVTGVVKEVCDPALADSKGWAPLCASSLEVDSSDAIVGTTFGDWKLLASSGVLMWASTTSWNLLCMPPSFDTCESKPAPHQKIQQHHTWSMLKRHENFALQLNFTWIERRYDLIISQEKTLSDIKRPSIQIAGGKNYKLENWKQKLKPGKNLVGLRTTETISCTLAIILLKQHCHWLHPLTTFCNRTTTVCNYKT